MDNIIAFPGPNGDLFTGYVRFKRALGYAIPVSYQYLLRDIARFIAVGQPEPGIISRAAMEELTGRRPHEAVPTQCKRIAILRQFCLWLASAGHTPTIPPERLARDTRFRAEDRIRGRDGRHPRRR